MFKGKFATSNVVNLSEKVLSNEEISFLQKGLKFIPTPINFNKQSRLSLSLTEGVKTKQLCFISVD